MKTETLERIVMGILEGKTRRELADRAEVTLDDLGKVTKDKCFSNLEYYKHKADARQDLFQAPNVDKILFEFEHDFPKKCNRYTRYDEKTGEPLPKKEQPPTHHSRVTSGYVQTGIIPRYNPLIVICYFPVFVF